MRSPLRREAAFQGVEVAFRPRCHHRGEDQTGIAEALSPSRADAIILCVGESAAMSGEAASRAHLGLPGNRWPWRARSEPGQRR